ncbi:MAG TPA: hypothetical protein VGM88_09305 [Kofleriaceae bacterium]|jgi:hypothetical protein
MPWSWELDIVRQFSAPMHTQLRGLSDAFVHLSRWLASRVGQVEPLWWKTRAFPVILLRDDAVTAVIESGQAHVLKALHPPLGFVDGLKAGGTAFVQGLKRPAEAIREAQLVPSFFGEIAKLTGIIAGSIAKWSVPDAKLFDPKHAQLFDLFGQLGLLAGTVLGSANTLMGIRNDIATAQQHWADAFPSKPGPEGAPPKKQPLPAASRTLAESLDMGVRYLVGGLLLLPKVTAYVELLAKVAGASLAEQLGEAFAGVVKDVYGYRDELMSQLYARLPTLVVEGLGTLFVVQDVLLDNLRFGAGFAVLYGQALAEIVVAYLDGLKLYVDDWIDTIDTVIHVVQAVLDFDLVPVLLAFLAPPAALLDAYLSSKGVVPRFTIGDWISVESGLARNVARAQLNVFLLGLETTAAGLSVAEWGVDRALDWSPAVQLGTRIFTGHWRKPTKNYMGDFLGRLGAIRKLVNIALAGAAPLPPVVTGGISLPPMPNLANVIAGPDGGRALIAAVLRTRDTALAEVDHVFGAGGILLGTLAGQADRWAAESTKLGTLAQYQAIARDADALQKGILPNEARLKFPDTKLAAGFDAWLVESGMQIAATAIPIYLRSLQDLWADHQDDVVPIDRETSPLILAKRAKLARVHVPKIKVNAEGRNLDDALVAELADQILATTKLAYTRGQRRLADDVAAIVQRDKDKQKKRKAGASP